MSQSRQSKLLTQKTEIKSHANQEAICVGGIISGLTGLFCRMGRDRVLVGTLGVLGFCGLVEIAPKKLIFTPLSFT